MPFDDDCAVFDDMHIELGEDGGTVVVAEFADREKRPSGEAIKNMTRTRY